MYYINIKSATSQINTASHYTKRGARKAMNHILLNDVFWEGVEIVSATMYKVTKKSTYPIERII